MRILQLHSDFIEYKPIEKEGKVVEEAEKKWQRFEELLVLFTCVEAGDDETVAKKAIGEIQQTLKMLKVNRILIYPYAHLSSNLAKPSDALKIIKAMEDYAKEVGIEAYRTPFGWNKQFSIAIKGHPLAEALKIITPTEAKVEKAVVAKKEYLIFTEVGKTYSPDDYKFREDEENFRLLVEKEALGMELKGGGEPEYIRHMKKFGIGWETMSDVGHMRYGPQASLIFDLIAEYSGRVANSIGIPVYSLKGTNMFNLDLPPVREHAELFGDRLYQVDVEKKTFVMRYAACHQQFAIIKDWQISYRHLPFGAFEVADSYRLEQSGELLLGFRVRRLNMPDLHVFCKDLDEAKEWFLKLHKKIYEEIKALGGDYVSLYNLTSKGFFEENKDFLRQLVKLEKKPALLCFYPPGINYYWTLNIEYHIIDKMSRPREIATVQIDVGNAKRFGIKFADKEGKENHPIILHTAIIGTIERYLYTLFDFALKMKHPALPLWLSPTQVRVIPVSDKFEKDAEKIVEKIERNNIRVDVDDRPLTLQKKIREAEMEWINYVVVIGQKEIDSGLLAVRDRRTGEIRQMKLEELVQEIRHDVADKPFKRSVVPERLSERPQF
jgi:threonyl-tRNA synthetase